VKARWLLALLLALTLIVAASQLALEAEALPLAAVHTLRADDELIRLAQEAGFETLVQVFSWREIEPTREEWHWEYPDFVVRAAHHYGLALIVRLGHQPRWATEPPVGSIAPPDDFDDFTAFAGTVARRYRGQIKGYVIWNEPNLAQEWGGQSPDPAAYTDLLCRAYAALKEADPQALVVSAGLASTNAQSQEAMDDRAFLEGMYQAGAGDCCDALGAHPYGFAYGPEDRHGAHKGLNLARLLDLREIMEAHGDREKPIWITELGWTTAGMGEDAWQTVTPSQQAEYLAGAWRKVQREWPWVEVFTVWNLSQGLPPKSEMAGYSLLEGSGEPRPAYHALRAELGRRWRGRLVRFERWLWGWLPGSMPATIPILAADEAVHLGDSE
jgi:hypothetical protein